MSYDLTMFEVRERETVESALERAEGSDRPGSPTAESDRLRRETCAALLEHDSKLDVFESARSTELTSLDDSRPAQITVYGDQASITMPYWHSGEAARTALAAVWQLIEIIHDRTGWILYDYQLDRQVDIAAGPGQLLGDYEHGTAIAAGLVTSRSNEDERVERPRRRRRFWLF